MTAPTRGSDTTINQIQADWTALSLYAGIGGSAVTSYELQWDAGSAGSSFVSLVGGVSDNLLTSFTATSTVSPG